MKIGLIGCGKQAPKHISGLRIDDSVEIVVCDIDAERAKKVGTAHDLAWTDDVEALFADDQVAAVDIATPTLTHAPLVRQAIESGKHYFCEKPFCESLADAEAIVARSEDAGVIGMVGYVYRHAPVFQVGHELCGNDDGNNWPLGKPVSAFFRIGGRGDHELWKHQKATSGGAISEMMVHMVDLAIWYFGEPQSASLIAQDLLRPVRTISGQAVEVDAEDYVLARFDSADGPSYVVQADLVTPAFSQYVEVQFEHGSYLGSIQGDVASYVFSTRDTDAYKSGKSPLEFGTVNLFERQMASFVSHVRERRPVTLNSVEDSLRLMRAMNLLNHD